MCKVPPFGPACSNLSIRKTISHKGEHDNSCKKLELVYLDNPVNLITLTFACAFTENGPWRHIKTAILKVLKGPLKRQYSNELACTSGF